MLATRVAGALELGFSSVCSVGCRTYATDVIFGAAGLQGCVWRDPESELPFLLGACSRDGPGHYVVAAAADDNDTTGHDASACERVSSDLVLRHVMSVADGDARRGGSGGGIDFRRAFQRTGVCAPHMAWAHRLRRLSGSSDGTVLSVLCGSAGSSRRPLCSSRQALLAALRGGATSIPRAISAAFEV